MNKERLLLIADFLEQNVHPDHWDFSIVMNSEKTAEELTQNFKRIAETHQPNRECGSAGCAVGWFPIIFPEDFEYVKHFNEMRVSPKNDYGGRLFRYVAEFLDINWSPEDITETEYLFEPHQYNTREETTKEQVAARIREFVRQKEANHE